MGPPAALPALADRPPRGSERRRLIDLRGHGQLMDEHADRLQAGRRTARVGRSAVGGLQSVDPDRDDPHARIRLRRHGICRRVGLRGPQLSFDRMVGLGIGLGLVAALFWFLVWRSRRVPSNRLVLWCLVAAGPAAVITMEAGWFVTEFGRQPWIVYGIIRTTAAATSAPGLGLVFAVFAAIYIGLAVTPFTLPLLLARHPRAPSHPQP